MTPRIMLVDDDTTLVRFIQEYLENDGFTVLAASNGQEALRLAYQEHPDLALVDVMMPAMDGWELTNRLRELSDIPIILLTAKSSEMDKLRGFRLGVDDYVTKPFSFAELTARIQAVLNRAQPQTSFDHNLVPIGDLLLDMDRREVRRGDEVIALTPTELRLLEVLAEKKGAAVAEPELIIKVWAGNRQEETAAVRRYVWMLRNKLGDDPTNPRYILTVRGFGYRLNMDSVNLPRQS